MAYLDQQHTHKRLAGATGVALVHIALAFGLVTGLAIKYTEPEEAPILEGGQIYLPPPPPPPTDEIVPDTDVTPAVEPSYTPPVVPIPRLDIVPTVPMEFTLELPPIVPLDPRPPRGGETGGAKLVQPPAFTPTGAAPRNGPAGWVTTNDYPLRALQRGWEGNVRYALDVGRDGKVNDCRIVSSSGHDVLDEAACRIIERRARFNPAKDDTGSAIAGTYTGAVTWLIPDD